MKLKLTPQRLAANRANAQLGGLVWKQKQAEAYNKNPSYCSQCNIILPQSKKHNKFCSRSCSATYNNTGREKAPRYGCSHCGVIIKTGKYCSVACGAEGKRKYSVEEAVKVKRNRVREVSANYRAKLKNQTPPDANRKAIQEFYDKCPSGHEVDHIVPISKGGLHTLSNLQYLTISDNRKKSNKM
jgi:5-methylcytosine-specific restriction endonuclease McrA